MRVIDAIERELSDERILRVWYLGANSLVLQSSSGRIYIDPFLVPAALHDGLFARREDPLVLATETRSLDGVLITHEHKDHCNSHTLRELFRDRSAPVVAPSVSAQIVREAIGEAAVKVVRPGDRLTLSGFDIEVCPSGDTVAADAVAYLIRYQNLALYVPGDLLSLPKGTLDRVKKLDAAFIPIATNPPGRRFYLSASEWVEIARQLSPRFAVPVHWDVWADYYFDPTVLQDYCSNGSIRIVQVGSSLELNSILAAEELAKRKENRE